MCATRSVRSDQPKHEVVVLATVEVRAETADLLGQRTAVHAEVARVHQRDDVVRAPARLGVAVDRAILTKDVLVAVEHVEFGVGGDAVGNLLQGVGGECVVVVQQRDVVARGQREGMVGGGGDPAGGVVAADADPLVCCRVLLERADDLRVARAVIDETELPVGVGLVDDRGNGLVQHVQRRVVHWREHRDQRGTRVGRGGWDVTRYRRPRPPSRPPVRAGDR